MHLTSTAGHVFLVTPVKAGDGFGTLTHRCPDAIHRRIAAANHNNPLALCVQLPVFKRRHIIAQPLPVGGCQKVQRFENARPVQTINPETARLVDTRRNQHRLMARPQLGKAQRCPYLGLIFEHDTARFEMREPPLDNVLFKLEARNTVNQQTAAAIIPVIDSDLIALAPQLLGRRQASRPRANDANALPTLAQWIDRHNPALLPSCVRNVFLDRTDRHCAVSRLLDHTRPLTQSVLRADTSANLGHIIGR